jgi:hypothetical protein
MNILVLNFSEIAALVCQATQRWGLYIRFDASDPTEEICKAAPYLGDGSPIEIGKRITILADGFGILLFDTENEMNHHFNRTIGEDGPTIANSYKGKVRVFALTCDPHGQLLGVNT